MWPTKLLEKIAPVVFNETKLKEHYDAYVTRALRSQWTSEASKLSSLIDFRDFAEDSINRLFVAFGAAGGGPGGLKVPIDRLVKALKATTEIAKRQSLSVAYVEENCLAFRPYVQNSKCPNDFVAWCLEKELDTFYKHAESVTKFRPLLKCSVESIELALKTLEASGMACTLEVFQETARTLGLTTLWPVLALWYSSKMGDVEEVFLNVPMPKVFGAPSCVRNAIERHVDPSKQVRTTAATKKLQLKNAILSGHGYFAYVDAKSVDAKAGAAAADAKAATGAAATGAPFKIVKAPKAYLCAPLPGMDHRHVWCLKPETLEAAIYKFEPEFACVAEFELPRDETEECPNWIDCQRDSEGALVLLWGHINSLTGSLYSQNAAALDEEAILAGSSSGSASSASAAAANGSKANLEFLSSIASMPSRRLPGQRVDWRDHGNLLSVHHSVEDSADSTGLRLWTHSYDIVFGSNLLMTLTTDARPIESIFGSPKDLVLLSPLSSSEPLQHWTLQEAVADAAGATGPIAGTAAAKPEYKMTASLKVPKLDIGHWQCVCIA
jgi:hypothetical protein